MVLILIGIDTVSDRVLMTRFLTFTAILVIPALALYLLFDFFSIGNEDSWVVVSLSFGLVLSAYFLLRFPIKKRHRDRTGEAKK